LSRRRHDFGQILHQLLRKTRIGIGSQLNFFNS